MSKKVSSTCALDTPRSCSSSSYTRKSLPWPTAEAACSSSIARGLMARSITSMPRAIAPEVTSTTDRPAACSSVVSAHSRSSASRRTTPMSSATMLDPSFTTVMLICPRLWGCCCVCLDSAPLTRAGLDRSSYFRLRWDGAEAGEAPGGARRLPGCRVGARRVVDDHLEQRRGIRAPLVDVGHHLRELLGLVLIDREQPVPARGAAQRAFVGPACRHPHRDARQLERARLELAGPVPHKAIEPVVGQLGALA